VLKRPALPLLPGMVQVLLLLVNRAGSVGISCGVANACPNPTHCDIWSTFAVRVFPGALSSVGYARRPCLDLLLLHSCFLNGCRARHYNHAWSCCVLLGSMTMPGAVTVSCSAGCLQLCHLALGSSIMLGVVVSCSASSCQSCCNAALGGLAWSAVPVLGYKACL
jgi:hypothetical protein